MKRLSIAVLALVLLSVRHGASAQSAWGTPMTVQEVQILGTGFRVIGVLQGDSAATTKDISFTSGTDTEKAAARENCMRLLLLAMSKPGQYLVRAESTLCAVRLATP